MSLCLCVHVKWPRLILFCYSISLVILYFFSPRSVSIDSTNECDQSTHNWQSVDNSSATTTVLFRYSPFLRRQKFCWNFYSCKKKIEKEKRLKLLKWVAPRMNCMNKVNNWSKNDRNYRLALRAFKVHRQRRKCQIKMCLRCWWKIYVKSHHWQPVKYFFFSIPFSRNSIECAIMRQSNALNE